MDEWEEVSSYSRKQAIEDGFLVDVSEVAQEAGIAFPVCLSRAVWEEYVEVPEGVTGQDVKGRLWDILYMRKVAIKRTSGASLELLYKLHVRNNNRPGKPPLVTLKSVCGPGDDAEPVITIMTLEED